MLYFSISKTFNCSEKFDSTKKHFHFHPIPFNYKSIQVHSTRHPELNPPFDSTFIRFIENQLLQIMHGYDRRRRIYNRLAQLPNRIPRSHHYKPSLNIH